MLKKIFVSILLLSSAISIFGSSDIKISTEFVSENSKKDSDLYKMVMEKINKSVKNSGIFGISGDLEYLLKNIDVSCYGFDFINKDNEKEKLSSCAFSQDHKYFACADSGKLKLWDSETFNCKTFENIRALGFIVFCCDNNYLAVTNYDIVTGRSNLEVYNLKDASLFKKFENLSINPTAGFTQICASPVAKEIATSIFNSGDIKVCNADTGHVRKLIDGNSAQILSILFSKCGNYIFGTHTSSDGNINIWDLTAKYNTPAMTIKSHSSRAVPGLGLLPNGSLVSLGFDETIKTWNWQKNNCLATQKFHVVKAKENNFVENYDSAFKYLSCSLDGKYAAIGSNNEVRLFNLENGQRINYLFKNLKQILFTPDSKFLILLTDKCLWLIKIV